MDMLTITVDSKGQLVIPPAELAALNLKPGQTFSVMLSDTAKKSQKFREVPPYDEDEAWNRMVLSTMTEWADPEDSAYDSL